MTYPMTAVSSPSILLPLALRDTAIAISSLAGGGSPTTFSDFRKQCDRQIHQLRAELTAAKLPADVIADAAYAQCALLDETALKHLDGDDRDAWEREPLQVRYFNSHDAGDELFRRIECRLAEPQRVLPLLAIFSAVLGLGFQGKFALAGGESRSALERAINERLDGHVTRDTSGTVLVRQGTTSRFPGFSALGWVVLASAMSGAIYLGAQHWLTASIDALPH